MTRERIDRFRDCGLLIIRIGLGIAFIFHGWPKITGGPKMWQGLGSAMPIPPPVFWGFVGSLTQFGRGILVMLGLVFRPACALLTIQMLVALKMNLGKFDPCLVYSR